MNNKEAIITILEKENLAPQKSKGQNFLIDEATAKSIVNLIEPYTDQVIEIGPGLGALTTYLYQKTTNLKVVEIDKGYVKILGQTYKDLQIIEKDFLKYSVPRETQTVISNIPYYITTKIIEKVICETPNLRVFVFMVQKEIEGRLFASPSTKDYGPLAIILNLTGKLIKDKIVTADKFYPRPFVDSAVFKFTKSETNFDIKDFYTFLKHIFLHRRKVLSKSLGTLFSNQSVNDVYTKLNIAKDERAEALSPSRILELYNELTTNLIKP